MKRHVINTMAQKSKLEKTVALIVAGGKGERHGGARPKQYALLAGIPVLRHAVERFAAHAGIAAVQVVIDPAWEEEYARAVAGLTVLAPVPGGATRQESVLAGLEALAEHAPSHVLVHDAARPMVSAALIDRVLEGLTTEEVVIPTLPIAETVKEVAEQAVVRTVTREAWVIVQTPQGFAYPALLEAHQAAVGKSLPDDAAVMEAAGKKVMTVAGEAGNIKLTWSEDIMRAEAMIAGQMETRVGMGFDVHRFGDGDAVMLCGVAVPHAQGLEGHSDADVALHAVVDGLLGVLAEGDIGQHFPPSDARWKDADSADFVAHAVALLKERGGQLTHVDVTIIGEAPKIAPHREALRARLVELLGVTQNAVSVKATTTERLGFLGREEGLAAQALVTVALPR